MKYATLQRVKMFFVVAGLLVLVLRGAWAVEVALSGMKQAVNNVPRELSATDESGAATQPIVAVGPHQAEQPTADLSNQPQGTSISEIVSSLDSSFSEEQADVRWSRPAEERVRTLFLPLTNKDTSLISLHCRSTLCRVESLHATEAEFYRFMNNLKTGGVTRGWRGQLVGGRVGTNDDGRVRSVFYLAKEGSNLPLGLPPGGVPKEGKNSPKPTTAPL